MQHHYSERWLEFFEAVLHELFGMYRSLRQQDAVKLVAVDLDNTLWRASRRRGPSESSKAGRWASWSATLFEKTRPSAGHCQQER